MIVELANKISSREEYHKSDIPKNTLSCTRYKRNFQSPQKRRKWALTDVSHEPIEGNRRHRTLSILRRCCPERTTLRNHGGVICRQYCGSSKGRAVTTNFARFVPSLHLLDNLSDASQKLQHSAMTDVLTCSCRWRLAAYFLVFSQTPSYFIVARTTYRGPPGHSRLMPCRLSGRKFNTE
jgi:hypothetical protein